jgi:hypothetical protein
MLFVDDKEELLKVGDLKKDGERFFRGINRLIR